MKDKYWAKNKYSAVDPVDYEMARFRTNAGKLIDETEKKAVADMLWECITFHGRKINILDVATGPGRLAFFLEKQFENAKITGMDINGNMLAKAKTKARQINSKVKFVQGDIYRLPFKDDKFDAVTGLRFSMHLPGMASFMKELARVVKKDGILIFDIFNSTSILRMKSSGSNSRHKDAGWYSLSDVMGYSAQNGLELIRKKGIFLIGETLLRKFPEKLLFLAFVFVTPPLFLQDFSTKIVLCLRKTQK